MDNAAVENHDFQVAVIGAGPAGARTAELLARKGISVVLFEAGGTDHEVLCSGLLNSEARQALGLELPDSVRMEPYQPLLEFRDIDNGVCRRFDPGYINMSRPLFDKWLRQRAVEAGAHLHQPYRVRRLKPSNNGIVIDTGPEQFSAKLAIDASGWRSMSRRLFGRPAAPQVHAFQGRVRIDGCSPVMKAYYLSGITPYYGWIVPKTGGEFLLGAGFPKGADSTREQHDDPWLKLRSYFAALEREGFQVSPLDPKPLGHPITCINRMDQLWWGQAGILPVGEAAGMVSPSSGDGISYCLQGATAVARTLSGLDFSELEYTDDGLEPRIHERLAARVRRNLRPALSEIRFNIAKAWIAARPRVRNAATLFLPLLLRRRVESLRFNS